MKVKKNTAVKEIEEKTTDQTKYMFPALGAWIQTHQKWSKKIRNNILPLIIFTLLISACGETKTENASPNQNTVQTNQNIAQDTGDNSANVAGNSSTKNKSAKKDKTRSNTKTPSGFTGTKERTARENDIDDTAFLSDVRTGRHDSFDRVVFEFSGAEMPGYYIEYIDNPVTQCGSGNTVTLSGNGRLEVRFTPAQAHTEAGQPTIENNVQNPNYQIIKQLRSTCDFEGYVTWVIGVSSLNNYRVMELQTPTRLVVDIQH